MRLHRPLDQLLSSPARIRLLRTLTGDPARTWTGRGLSKASGASQTQTLAALAVLEENGIVAREVVGRADLWRVCGENVLVGPLQQLFESEERLEGDLVRKLRDELESLPVDRASIFGSIARGDEGTRGDIDLFLEVPDDRARSAVEGPLTKMTVRFVREYGRVLSPLILTRREKRRHRNPKLLRKIEAEGRSVMPG
jgi:predicted nucleotidyltransferase